MTESVRGSAGPEIGRLLSYFSRARRTTLSIWKV
jgi:hypothetical protein